MNAPKVISDYLGPLYKNEYSINDTQKFPTILSSIPPLQDDEEDVSYDIESLFTNILIQETVNYITEQIYVHKKLTPISSKLIFRILLIKLATECTFKFNNRFLQQVDRCTMGGPLSVTFSDIYMVKMENDVAIPSKPIFCWRFVDDIYRRRKLGDNVLFDQSNSCHPNIKLTIEVNPSKSVDTKLTNINCTYKFNVYWKNTKLPSPWTSKTPKHHKRNTINDDLHCSSSSNFDEEIPLIKEKFMKADYPLHFINSVINEFQKGKDGGDESFIIPTSLFEIAKPLIFVEIPYCELNEIKSKHFLKKFHKFTNNSFRMVVTYHVLSIEEIVRVVHIRLVKPNAEVRWNEYNNPTKSLEPSKHLGSNINHYFTWAVISNAPKNGKTQKNEEASNIALWKSDLNEQKDFERLVLFRNGVTWSN